jgi:uncharacterized protein GlcG (DUF336 family)
MTRQIESLTLADARTLIAAAEIKAKEIGLPYNIAVVDAGANLIAFVRQDNALIGSVDLAINKAVTARYFDKTTAQLWAYAQPGQPLYGIQTTNHEKVVIFGGGLPIFHNGTIIGAIGTSAGTVEQDVAVAEAGVAALGLVAA